MPCSDAMIKNVLTVKPSDTVEKVLHIFEDEDIRSVPVLDDAGNLVGLFGLRHVFLKLLPASVTMEDGLTNLDFVIGASPGIAKRLKKLYPVTVEEVMDKDPTVLHKDTATWEALRIMALKGSPISIVEEGSKVFVGMISRQTLLAELHRLMDEIDEENNKGE